MLWDKRKAHRQATGGRVEKSPLPCPLPSIRERWTDRTGPLLQVSALLPGLQAFQKSPRVTLPTSRVLCCKQSALHFPILRLPLYVPSSPAALPVALHLYGFQGRRSRGRLICCLRCGALRLCSDASNDLGLILKLTGCIFGGRGSVKCEDVLLGNHSAFSFFWFV